MPKPLPRGTSKHAGRTTFVLIALFGILLGMLPIDAPPAAAAPALTVTPITFDVIGLDSNNVTVGPDLFPVGARICNTGDVTLTGGTATLVFQAPLNPYLTISGPSTIGT